MTGLAGPAAAVVARSAALFVLAGLLEIGGGYLVWQWLRAGRPVLAGVAGAAMLALYGVVATYQPADFGRVYAAYGGVFIVLALLWSWGVDGRRPDLPAVNGAASAAHHPASRTPVTMPLTLDPAPGCRFRP